MFGLRSKHHLRAGSCLAVLGVAACSGQASAPSSSLNRPEKTTAGTLSIPFPGAGNGGQAQVLLAGFTPNACTVAGPSASFDGGSVQVAGPDHVTCYFSSVSSAPMAFLEQIVETAEGQGLVHVRLTMNPAFVDNTYGDTAIGWGGSDAGAPAAMPGSPMAMPGGPMSAGGPPPAPGPNGHKFDDLVESDHAEFDLTDATGAEALSFDLDYISATATALSGYATLGVTGGDGKMLIGSGSNIIYASTSLDRDLNACGYSLYTTNSPATDADYTPNAATPNWDYRVVYDVWVDASAFAGGFGAATIPYVHASPAKLGATLTVTPGPCPPPFDCDGGVCATGDTECEGEGCLPSSSDCVGEGCDDATAPVIPR